MGKSLFLTSEVLFRHMLTLDNLAIAKRLHDLGKPFPSDRCFVAEFAKQDSFFYDGLRLFFNCPICIEDDRGFEDSFEPIIFTIRIPLVEEWYQLTQHLSDEEATKEKDWILSPIKELWCDYFEVNVSNTFTEFGLNVLVEGDFGFFQGFFDDYDDFYKRLEEKVIEKRNKVREDESYDSNSNNHSRRQLAS
ncbi:hypothetical protein J2S74_002939 [Evansella vedderi]|uniref:Uncharacterized protein n=1 Tax=Evansella vedderi TaxID=38282 RepID=A0ABT9ZWF5_9BACI|nr:hypothetical protein [Evansella vedderi]MDQ0255557.1 hypothetical protein [Evansella vedderi]